MSCVSTREPVDDAVARTNAARERGLWVAAGELRPYAAATNPAHRTLSTDASNQGERLV
jgi:hypothetical protein